ncbi:MAG TPA: hypothetical protein VEW64_01730 [Methyloceanibacter sp.]|jgi:hypothetical protein|nr:hypothetical protein [Methyloceanibacter sp.]
MTPSRILLIVLTLWGLALIVPDLIRVVQPLGSLGFSANNDGLIYDVDGPFPDEASSPAWRAGIRVGDQLDLERMRCRLGEIAQCGNALAVFGGVDYMLPGQAATIDLVARDGRPARQVTLIAEQSPSNFLVRIVNLLCQIAGILVILAAAWLVWSRPGAMSWGFFLYVNWFNPGQVYAFEAILAQWPTILLAHDLTTVFAQAAGYAALLLFVLRVPNNKTEPRWQPVERALPVVALFFAIALLASYGSVFGHPTETITRATILAGFAVDVGALAILFDRRRTQTPEDSQRVRWVIWGCLIGLPAFLIAELASTTTIFETRWGDFTPSEDIIGLLYLVNGILCLFVFEALRRPRVVSVAIPLRRVTILGLTLSIPVLVLHHQVERMQEHLQMPGWAWLLIGGVTIFLITKLHEGAVHLADRYFNRSLDAVERELSSAMLKAKELAQIDRLLAQEPFQKLKLTSAASFLRAGHNFVRGPNAEGWDERAAAEFESGAPLLAPLASGKPFTVPEEDGTSAGLPDGLARPVVAVPAASPLRCYAVSFYGPHTSGTDLDANERAMLARLAAHAATMYAELENGALRGEIARLQRELAKKKAPQRAGGSQ